MKLLFVGILVVIGLFFWTFVGLEKTGRMSNCHTGEVIWSSSKGFNPCVNLGKYND